MLCLFKRISTLPSTILSHQRLPIRMSSTLTSGGKGNNDKPQEYLYRVIATRLNIPPTTARYVVEQSKKGSTVPFLARYRRDETGNMDETTLRQLLDMAEELQEVNRRRTFMLKNLKERGLLTDELKESFEKLLHLNQLEDAWEPFKEKKTSLSHRGREAGLEPLVKKLLHTVEPITELNERLNSVTDGIKLFQAIIIEEVQRCDEIRQIMLSECRKNSIISSLLSVTARKKSAKEITAETFETLKKQFSPYDNRRWSVQRISAHQVLALQRGETKGVLLVKMIPHSKSQGVFFSWARHKFIGTQRVGQSSTSRILNQFLEAAYDHIIKSTHNTIRRDLKKSAEKEAIEVFAHNLRQILLQCPLRDARVLAMDPGISNGVKCVALDENGGVLTRFKCTILDESNMKDYITSCIQKLNLNKIVIGNGTASRQVADIVADTIEQRGLNVEYAIVSEAGASVYSVSDVAKEEFPTLDPMYRGAVNIGRRVIDPLSELVKIPVRSMGIGMYQHDMNENEMVRALNRVVESCVTSVGVNAMITNRYVMEKIPGVTKRMVDQIVLARHAKKLKSREDMRRVPGMTEAVYQQIAGFFRFPNSSNPLDNSNIHPESYYIVHKLLDLYKGRERREVGEILIIMESNELNNLATNIGCGKSTLELVAKELASPALDPRSELPHAGLFRRAPCKVEDLKIGDKLTGVIQSVTTFGAFVDVGLHDNVLVRGLNIDTVHVGGLLEDLKFEGLDQLGRLRVRYDGSIHSSSSISSDKFRQGLALESEDLIVLKPNSIKTEYKSLSDTLAVVREERQQLFASSAPSSLEGGANRINDEYNSLQTIQTTQRMPKRQREEEKEENEENKKTEDVTTKEITRSSQIKKKKVEVTHHTAPLSAQESEKKVGEGEAGDEEAWWSRKGVAKPRGRVSKGGAAAEKKAPHKTLSKKTAPPPPPTKAPEKKDDDCEEVFSF